jgi:predicted O-methyltransferase YrrM
LVRSANEILANYLKHTDIGLELGSGRTTIWFALRVGHITGVEYSEAFFRKVNTMLGSLSLENKVTYYHAPKDKGNEDGGSSAYAEIIDTAETESVDFVLVDGIHRDFCSQRAIRVMKPGGLLIIDNVNWFLPSESVSPNRRTSELGPNGPVWENVSRCIAEWRSIWTSSGVTDTTFYFKPCNQG